MTTASRAPGSRALASRVPALVQEPERRAPGPTHGTTKALRAAHDARASEILQMLRDAGGRVTAPRRAVIDALLAAGDHPTAEDLASSVQRVHPDVAVSTIYRTLEHLEELGVLVHVHLGHGPAVYHFSDDTHAHLVCRGCGYSAPLATTVTRSIARSIQTASGFRADLAHFSITGLCESCAK